LHYYYNFQKLNIQYPNLPFVCYGTSPLPIKLLADYITIPGRVVETIESINAPQVLFAENGDSVDTYVLT